MNRLQLTQRWSVKVWSAKQSTTMKLPNFFEQWAITIVHVVVVCLRWQILLYEILQQQQPQPREKKINETTKITIFWWRQATTNDDFLDFFFVPQCAQWREKDKKTEEKTVRKIKYRTNFMVRLSKTMCGEGAWTGFALYNSTTDYRKQF